MSEPFNVFQQTRKHLKTGNLTFLKAQVAELAEPYEPNSTAITPTGTMASRVL